MFKPYSSRPRRHFSSDSPLNVSLSTRAGLGALLASTSSPRTWLIFLYGAQGPLYDFGPLPLQNLFLFVSYIFLYSGWQQVEESSNPEMPARRETQRDYSFGSIYPPKTKCQNFFFFFFWRVLKSRSSQINDSIKISFSWGSISV